jgi:hypothetical protein
MKRVYIYIYFYIIYLIHNIVFWLVSYEKKNIYKRDKIIWLDG